MVIVPAIVCEENLGVSQCSDLEEGVMTYLSFRPVKLLPDPVHLINVAMMKVKDGLKWGEIEVATRVTS